MGVRTTIVIYATSDETGTLAANDAFVRIAELEQVLSDWRVDSDVNQLCAKSGLGPVPVSPDLLSTLKKSLEVAAASEGAFDPTIAPLVRLWRETKETGVLPSDDRLRAARSMVDWRKVRLDEANSTVELQLRGMRLDFGAIGKGLAAQAAVDRLKSRGVTRCLVALAGDVACGDPPPNHEGWSVAVPSVRAIGDDPSAVLLLANQAVSTSGDAEQFVVIGEHRYSHILDPTTGLGLEHAFTTTVVAPRGEDADALSTAACAIGPDRARALLARYPRSAAVMVDAEERGGGLRIIDSDRVLHWRGAAPQP